MEKTQDRTEILQFIFTEKEFCLDAQASWNTGEEDSWGHRFASDRYYALYEMGFAEKPAGLTATGSFLRLVSEVFLKGLTSLPELELAREKVEFKPSGEDVETLLKAVPFAIGAEYINAK